MSVRIPSKLVWDNILTLPYYQPGKPIEEVRRELGITDIVKLASNENPLGPSPRAVEALRKCLGELNRYPDASGHYLRERLAEIHGVKKSQIVLGNGSDEIITMVVSAFLYTGEEAVIPYPSFIRYETGVQMMDGVKRMIQLKDYHHDLDAMAEAVNEKTKLIFICNPNNPTGTMMDRRSIRDFMERIPYGPIVVFDEAYHEYVTSPDYPDTLEYVEQQRPVVILRTFSKIYGLAGLRIGYGITTEEIGEILQKVRSPFNTSTPAQKAALAALDDKEFVQRSVELNEKGKKTIYACLEELGLPYCRSWTNFILFDSRRNAMDVFNALLRKGVIIRPLSILGRGTYLRVNTGLEHENERFCDALREVIEKIPESEDVS